MRPVEEVIQKSKHGVSQVTKQRIKEIVLCGGSTRIPKIQSMLSEMFDGKQLNKSIDPDLAVSIGATR